VVFAGLEEDAVAGSDYFDRTAFALAEADALGDPLQEVAAIAASNTITWLKAVPST
jgi:hypothetical protein